MNRPLKKIVIVGGGSAGWLTAGVIAAEHQTNTEDGIEITLIESADIATIGVGEGTWPSMRSTLQKMGISETEFLTECDASFKQGSKFSQWNKESDSNVKNADQYYHPFTLPIGNNKIDVVPFWQNLVNKVPFADAVCAQSHLSHRHLAPKQITTTEYTGITNYGYHLDAGKFGAFLKRHCTTKLGVKHIIDHVELVNSAKNGDIASVKTKIHGDIQGDLFIDCTGTTSLLLAKHFNVPFISKKHILFNDSAMAVHVPYPSDDSDIASFTQSTAQNAGWIWDIGLPSRRGVGYTYSSAHSTDELAEKTLRQYLTSSMGEAAKTVSIRKLSINPGHREKMWHKNCIAIGMSAGFIEPLEASALALIEFSAKMVSEQLPANRQTMDIIAKRFNDKLLCHWQQLIDFLKLHYVLSHRDDSAYWRDNRTQETIPETLQEQLDLWQYQTPSRYDIPYTEELFPAASFQYILYGMGFITQERQQLKRAEQTKALEALFSDNAERVNMLLSALPTNRVLINKIKEFGLSKI